MSTRARSFNQERGLPPMRLMAFIGGIGLTLLSSAPAVAGGSATPITLAQVPLTIAIPAHPQVLFAVGNSESMDGNLSGAIMTGSGSLGPGLAALNAGSSPTSYTVPPGFIPPVAAGSGGIAPYTATVGGYLVDNSASRLNSAKAGMLSVLQSFLANADFALMDYQTSGLRRYGTWVYYMSPNGSGFTFTSTPGASRYVVNPCNGVNVSAGGSLANDCNQLQAYYGSSAGVTTQPYMLIGASSDDPMISDVLYANLGDPVVLNYGGVSPASPYPPYRSLADYNNYNVSEEYSKGIPGAYAGFTTTPTNAGFVGYSPEMMYAQRGFGYYTTSQSSTTGTLEVSMTSAGATPTSTSIATAMSAFTPYLQPETSSTSTVEIKAKATQSPIAGLLKGAGSYLGTHPPSSNGCAPTQYVVLVTDGLPTQDLNGRAWPPLGTASAAGYGETVTFNGDGSLGSTNDQALTDTISQLAALQSAGIKTYIIGVGAGVDPAVNPTAASTLTAMAIAGGTGSYFAAQSSAAIVTDMQVILAKILASTQSTASVAVNSTGLQTGAYAYQARFTTSDTQQDWTGNLFEYPVNTTTGAVATNAASAVWSAQTQLDGQNWDTGRMIATWDPVTQSGTPFRWNPSSSATSGIASSTGLGAALTTFPPDSSAQDILQFLRGSNAKEVRFGGQLRNRTHKLGDIVNSSPIYIGAPNGSYVDSSYQAFQSAYAARPPVLYVGANDGMLHAIDAVTGNERFAFIPNGVYANLPRLANPYYNGVHQYFVDGSPQYGDVQFSDNTWHTVLVGGENAGGKDIYALDVTDPASITTEATLASIAMWDFTDGNMGYSFSAPAITRTAAGFAAIFGNGYDSPTQSPFLYALNPQTGAVIAKIDLCAQEPTACNGSVSNGLSSVTTVNSSGSLSGPADTVYAGDLQGNLWRINIADSNPANWTAMVLFQAQDALGNPQPITTAPAVTLNPKFPRIRGTMVFVGTGQMLAIADLANSQVQTVYGIYDSGSGGALVSPTIASAITRSSLVAQTLLNAGTVTNSKGMAVPVRTITSYPVPLPSRKGWLVDFNLLARERIVTDPLIDSGAVVVTSNQPASNSCTGGNAAYLNEFNFATGGAFSNPQFDVTGSGNLTGTAYASMSLGTVFAATPVIMSANLPGNPNRKIKQIGLSSSQISSVTERGAQQQRTAWWELR